MAWVLPAALLGYLVSLQGMAAAVAAVAMWCYQWHGLAGSVMGLCLLQRCEREFTTLKLSGWPSPGLVVVDVRVATINNVCCRRNMRC
jgi:hypothetical protein